VDDRSNKQCRRSEAQWLGQFREATSLKRREVAALIEWRFAGDEPEKQKAMHGVTGPAQSGHARRCVKKALATPSATAALDCLLGDRGGIPGWGPAMASAVLAACRPDIYCVADSRALRTLRALDLYSPNLDDEFTRDDWWPYLSISRKLATISGLSLQEVARALWAAADDAPRLPATPRSAKT